RPVALDRHPRRIRGPHLRRGQAASRLSGSPRQRAERRRSRDIVVSAPGRRILGVCADDVGLVAGVAETVVALAADARLSAASCVANAPGWRPAAAVLARSKAPVALGLHFNLTEG